MLIKIKQFNKDETGFSLVELLVVIIIISILAAVAIPAFTNQRQRANDSTVLSDIRGINFAVKEASVQCPDADFLEIVRKDTLGGVGTMGTKQHVSYDRWLESPDNIVVHLYTAPFNDDTNCLSAPITLSEGVNIFVTRNTGQPNDFGIYGWHTNGKAYPGGDYDTATEVRAGYTAGEIAKFDTLRGKFLKAGE